MSILGGVPVFILSVLTPIETSCSVSPWEDNSPILPPSIIVRPINNLPLRKVPAVRITVRDLKIAPVSVLTPQIFEFSKRKDVAKSA